MEGSRKILISVIVLLVIGNIIFAFTTFSSISKQKELEKKVALHEVNGNVLDFAQLFMEKVLLSDKEVSFDDRLQLENSVRNINDKEIFSAWQNFTNAKDQNEVQKDFYNLFDLLLKKISS